MNKIKETKNSVTYRSNRGHTLQITCHYPKKNPESAVEEITCALAYLGVLMGLKKNPNAKLS